MGSAHTTQIGLVVQDRESRQIIAIHVGNRGEAGARGRWQAIPEGYRQKATFIPMTGSLTKR